MKLPAFRITSSLPRSTMRSRPVTNIDGDRLDQQSLDVEVDKLGLRLSASRGGEKRGSLVTMHISIEDFDALAALMIKADRERALRSFAQAVITTEPKVSR